MRTDITKSHLNSHICQHRGMKTSTVTPSFYYVFNISLYCNDSMPSFIGNLWRVLLLGNHLNPFTPKSDFIDFTLSNARRFYSSKGSPLGVKGLNTKHLSGKITQNHFTWRALTSSKKFAACKKILAFGLTSAGFSSAGTAGFRILKRWWLTVGTTGALSTWALFGSHVCGGLGHRFGSRFPQGRCWADHNRRGRNCAWQDWSFASSRHRLLAYDIVNWKRKIEETIIAHCPFVSL